MFTIEELSRKVGCHIETCRYYEKLGFIHTSNNTYDITHQTRLLFILKMRNLGFNLEQISGLLQFSDSLQNSTDDILITTSDYLRLINHKIRELQAMETYLVELASNYQKHTPSSKHLVGSIMDKLTASVD